MARRYVLGIGVRRRAFPAVRVLVVTAAVTGLAAAGAHQLVQRTPPTVIRNGQPVIRTYEPRQPKP